MKQDPFKETKLNASNRYRIHALQIGLLVVLGAVLRIWNMGWGLPEFYEEGIPLRAAYEMWSSGRHGFDFLPATFVYPAFTFYLQFLIQGLHFLVGSTLGVYHGLDSFCHAWETNPTAFVIIGRATSILFDCGSIVLAYIIGKRHLNVHAGILAAVMIAVNPLHIQESHLINVDTPLTFFVLLSLLFAYRLVDEQNIKWYILSGISIGLAAATKYNGALLFLLLLTAHVLKVKTVKEAFVSLKSPSLLTAIILAGFIFAVFNPYILLRFGDFMRSFSEVETHMTTGHLGLDKNTSTLSYYFLDSLPKIMGWPMMIVVILSVIKLIIARSKKNLLLVSFPFYFILTIGVWAMRADRYIFPIVPNLILIGSIGMCSILAFRQNIDNRPLSFLVLKLRRWSPIVLIILIILVIGPQISSVLTYQRMLSLPDTRAVVKQWIERNITSGSAIASGPFGIDLEKDNYLVLSIPFNAGGTEKTIAFYDARWYEDLDVVITSDYDYGRYLQEPGRFHDILRFYDTLHSSWKLIFSTAPGDSQSGPTFWLYQCQSRKTDSLDVDMMNKVWTTADSNETNEFFLKLAEISATKQKYMKSEQLLLLLINENPNNSRTQKDLAYTEHRLHHDDFALQLIQTYLQSYPKDASQLAFEGEILYDLHRIDESELTSINAHRLDNNLELPYVTLSMIYSLRGDRAKMIDILSHYLSVLPPTSPRAGEVRAILLKIQQTR